MEAAAKVSAQEANETRSEIWDIIQDIVAELRTLIDKAMDLWDHVRYIFDLLKDLLASVRDQFGGNRSNGQARKVKTAAA